MKIGLLSDLHLEFGDMPASYRAPDCDVMVLAGDIGFGNAGVEFAKRTFPDRPVIVLAGNHECYDRRVIQDQIREAQEAAHGSNVHFLNNALAVIGRVAFLGATLWTDFELDGSVGRSMRFAADGMNDYRLIRWRETDGVERTLRPQDTADMHRESAAFLAREIETFRDSLDIDHVVVCTHHAPSRQSIAPKYVREETNAAYASDMSRLCEGGWPRLWLHGHVHSSFDYDLNGTRVVANPRGYVRRYDLESPQNARFDPSLVIEI